MRLLHSLIEVIVGSFSLQAVPRRGERAAIRHWEAHDAGYLRRVRAYLAETARPRQVALYEELAELAVAPVGRLSGHGEVAVSGGAGYGAGPVAPPAGTVADAHAFWQGLVDGGPSGRPILCPNSQG